MNKPTKTQLSNAVTHFADGIREVVSGNTVLSSVEDYKEFLENLLNRAPSLEPQTKAVVEVETADVVESEVVDA
jgi:cobalamin biosynthesis Co2+ chelatase CbiK